MLPQVRGAEIRQEAAIGSTEAFWEVSDRPRVSLWVDTCPVVHVVVVVRKALVVPAPERRVCSRRHADIPLAVKIRPVAGRREELRQRDHAERNPLVAAHTIVRIVVHDIDILGVDVERVAAGLHRGAGWSAETPSVRALKLHALRKQPGHGRRADLTIGVVAGRTGPGHIRPAQIVLQA